MAKASKVNKSKFNLLKTTNAEAISTIVAEDALLGIVGAIRVEDRMKIDHLDVILGIGHEVVSTVVNKDI